MTGMNKSRIWIEAAFSLKMVGLEHYLLCPQHYRHHTLWLGGLGALINQNGAELHLGQARISGSDAGAANHISVLDNKEDYITSSCLPCVWDQNHFLLDQLT